MPNDLPPPGFSIDASTWPLITEAMHEVGRLDGATTSLPDPGILLRPLERREALRSSSLEGTYATPRELLLFELPDSPPSGNEGNVNDWREVSNYRVALSQSSGDSVIKAPLYLIRQLHHVLLTGVRGSDQTPGAFRTGQVFIGTDHRFIPPPPTHVQQCLASLEAFIKDTTTSIPPLVRAFLVHYQFETIHPFRDGNGRVGRLLMAIMIREFCNHRSAWLYLSPFLERFKDEYIDRLFAVSTRGSWIEWINFCLRATIVTARDTFDRCRQLLSLREAYRAQVGDRARLPAIVDTLFENPLTRIKALVDRIGVSNPTARTDVDHLVKLGILSEVPDMYPKTFYAPAIFRISYMEPDGGEPSIEK